MFDVLSSFLSSPPLIVDVDITLSSTSLLLLSSPFSRFLLLLVNRDYYIK